MGDLTNKNFGLLIAFLLPGFVTLLGLGCMSDVAATWVYAGGANAPSVGGFLYLTLASLLAGLTVSTIRWAVIARRAFSKARFETRVVHPFATKQYRMPADPGNKTDETDLYAQHRAAVAGFGLCELELAPPYRHCSCEHDIGAALLRMPPRSPARFANTCT